jgi:hypothetical protein
MNAIFRYGGFIDMHPSLGMWTALEEMLPESENDRIELNVIAAAALPKSSSPIYPSHGPQSLRVGPTGLGWSAHFQFKTGIGCHAHTQYKMLDI